MRFSTLFAIACPLLASAHPVLKTRANTAAVSAVLRFAELLEQLEKEFYTQALQKFQPSDFTAAGLSVPDVAIQGFKDILEHESAHVTVLDQALEDNGDKPISGCTFNFEPVLTDVATMAAVARVVEHVGVGAYLGGADILDDKTFLAAAATILTVEARHQSFLNIISGATTVPQGFDVALSPPDVLSIAGAFVSGCDPAAELGLPPANPPLAVTNQGVIAPGTRLEFSSPALNETSLASASCQMLVGGQAFSLSFPANECIVPEGIDGPVWIWLTTDEQPLAADIHVRASSNILAGPTAAFLDTKTSALGALIRNNGAGFGSSETISPSEAQDQLSSATETATETAPATETATVTEAPNATFSTAPAAVTTPAAASSGGSGGATPPIRVIGVGVIPA
ncbi:hypothetical protein FRC17_009972 [Serendipita sp. 399]|nr:hypothetical protein FRC17_009972 [Serendipita sp. 399]